MRSRLTMGGFECASLRVEREHGEDGLGNLETQTGRTKSVGKSVLERNLRPTMVSDAIRRTSTIVLW